MNYYFDESGNWKEIENETNRLVLAGLVIRDKNIARDLGQEFALFKSENNLEHIHASEIKDKFLKEELYKIISRYISLDDVLVLGYLIDPKMLFSQTMKDPDEIYIDTASNLIGEMVFGDKDINIEYDMKFHYAYPQKILENMDKKRDYDDYIQMSKNFYLKKHSFEKQKDRIKKNILRVQNRVENSYEVLKKLEDISFVNSYLWEEFRLKTEKSAILREKFKDKIYSYINQQAKLLNLNFDDTKVKIAYKNKYQQSAGVEMIDVINNLLWRYGKTPPGYLSNAVKTIFKNMEIKEITNE